MTKIELREDVNDQNLDLQNVDMTRIWTSEYDQGIYLCLECSSSQPVLTSVASQIVVILTSIPVLILVILTRVTGQILVINAFFEPNSGQIDVSVELNSGH